MMLTSLMYVSQSKIPPASAETVVKQIVAAASVHNERRAITGALLFTGTHFVQLLEGHPEVVDSLMASIIRDERHERFTIVDRSPLDERLVPNWRMAYFGPSKFVGNHATRLLNDPTPDEQGRAVTWLKDTLCEFARTSSARLF